MPNPIRPPFRREVKYASDYEVEEGWAAIGNQDRPGKSSCECHNVTHDIHSFVGAVPCNNIGTMHDGWFICRDCVTHAPQLRLEK